MMSIFQSIAQAVAEHVLNSIPASVLIVAFVWLALQVFGKQSSRARFAVWFVTFLLIAALPFASILGEPSQTAGKVSAQITLPNEWVRGVFMVWFLIAAMTATRLIAGICKLRRLRKNSIPLESSSVALEIRKTIEQFQATRSLEVRRSSDVRVPTAIGFFKPTILLPAWAFDDLAVEDLRAVLLHEFAHLRRLDDWTNLAQKLVHTLFFFHPAIWWVEKRLALEREMACDELVLAETGNRRAYAECLVSLAEKSLVRRGMAMAQTIIGRAGETSLRLARILYGEPAMSRLLKPVLGILAGITAAALIALPHVPKLIAFQNVVPRSMISDKANIAPSIMNVASKPGNNTLNSKQVTLASARASSVPSPRVFPAKQKGFASLPRLLVRTSNRQQISSPEMLVIMQTTEYDGFGSAKMRFCVWRVTFSSDGHNTVQAEVVAKSI